MNGLPYIEFLITLSMKCLCINSLSEILWYSGKFSLKVAVIIFAYYSLHSRKIKLGHFNSEISEVYAYPTPRGQSVALYREYCIRRGGHIIKITNRFFENVATPQYVGTTVTNQNLIHEEINITLNARKIPIGDRKFPSPKRPDRLWDPPSLLSNR
jgi:hypothetical protein